ncbi:hypothetical protein B0H14DRAFT_2666831 [Mycena olivaceomarginata]|nr:hypothetical protein B0H14DRAFT_2666831 [Mycena olivaceomarginata]
MTIQLPQELIELVIDQVALESRPSLKSCSLVRRSWVPRSRSRLFERLGSHAIRNLVRSPYCTFLPHVRTVLFSSEDFDDILVEDMCRLTHVRTLDVYMYNCDVPEKVYSFLAAAFPDITSLQVSCNLPGQPPPIDFISCFAALRELDIHDSVSDRLYHPSGEMPSPPPRGLRRMKLSGNSPGPILAWLHATRHLPNVDSLVLDELRSGHIAIVRAALQQIGGALRHLELSAGWSFTDSHMATLAWLDLSPHPELKSLAIVAPPRGYSGDFGPGQVLPLLMMLSAPSLEQLELDFTSLPLDQSADWAALDALLSSARFSRLRSVTVVLLPDDGDAEFMRMALPLLKASGVLRPE